MLRPFVVYVYIEAEDRVVVIAFHDARTSDAAIARSRGLSAFGRVLRGVALVSRLQQGPKLGPSSVTGVRCVEHRGSNQNRSRKGNLDAGGGTRTPDTRIMIDFF
jgi:hypothetical protein